MLIYNTTYHVDFDDARNFVIWIHQAYIPKALESGLLSKPRLCKILSHHDEDSECFSLQFEVEDSARLHRWYVQCGEALHEEMQKVFKDKAAGFTTLMEIIEESGSMPRTSKGEKIILGIDPGTNIMGYGVLKVTGHKAQMEAMGVIDLRKYGSPYLKLGRIFERVTGIIESYLPDEMAIEAPFFGKNVQSMLKLGRAQGVAIAAAIHRDIPITEYAPLKIKMAITGNGQASKEQVAGMLTRILHIREEEILPYMDATDGLAAAYCHYLQMGRPEVAAAYHNWKDFIRKNPEKVSGNK